MKLTQSIHRFWVLSFSEQHRCRLLKVLTLLGAASLLLMLWVPVSGEEGTYTTNALEMWQSGHYFNNTMAGMFYPRPPLMKFLVMCVAYVIGFKHVLIASRLVTASATIGSGVVTFFLAKSLSGREDFAWWSAAIFFSGDTIMRHGWLAYADPTYGFFVISSLACCWWAVEKRSAVWLLCGCLCVFLAFITKDLRPFAFYGSLGVVLLWRHRHRWFLFRPISLVAHALLLCSPFIWSHYTVPAYLPMMWQTLFTSMGNTWHHYLYTVFFYQPLMLFAHLLPVSVLAFYVAWKNRRQLKSFVSPPHFYEILCIAFITAMINWISCWLSWSQWPEARYYLPVYPLFAISFAVMMYFSAESMKRKAVILLTVVMFLKWISSPWLFILIENHSHHYPQIVTISSQTVDLSKNKPLYLDGGWYANDQKIAQRINVLRWPHATIKSSQFAKEKTYLAVTGSPQAHDKIIRHWPGHINYYLVCRGKDC